MTTFRHELYEWLIDIARAWPPTRYVITPLVMRRLRNAILNMLKRGDVRDIEIMLARLDAFDLGEIREAVEDFVLRRDSRSWRQRR